MEVMDRRVRADALVGQRVSVWMWHPTGGLWQLLQGVVGHTTEVQLRFGQDEQPVVDLGSVPLHAVRWEHVRDLYATPATPEDATPVHQLSPGMILGAGPLKGGTVTEITTETRTPDGAVRPDATGVSVWVRTPDGVVEVGANGWAIPIKIEG